MLQQEAKLAVEPAAAATLAALARPLNKKLKNKKVGLLMCGANIDALSYSSLLERGEQFIKSDKWIYKF
jgi:threonine dehydratase